MVEYATKFGTRLRVVVLARDFLAAICHVYLEHTR